MLYFAFYDLICLKCVKVVWTQDLLNTTNCEEEEQCNFFKLFLSNI